MIHANYKTPVKRSPSAPTCANCGPPKHPCPQNVIFNCHTGAGVTTGFIFPPFVSPPETPISLVCTTLDTTCLCKSIVKIEFNCTVNFTFFGTGPMSLNFQLKKSCDNGQEVVCGAWTLTKDLLFGQLPNDSFEFAFCDCNSCPGCCTYTVEVIFEAGIGANLSVSINAPTIKAIAMESCRIATGIYGDQDTKCPPTAPACADCQPKQPCPQGVLFNCITGAGIQPTSVCPATPRSLVCITMDTTCLCRPLITLDFSAIIAVTLPAGTLVNLTFQVKKNCDNEQKIECGSWMFERIPVVNVATSDSFRFTFCDCNPCPGRCTYSVELISCNAIDFSNPLLDGNFSINAPTATVLAVDICPQS